MSAEDTSPAAGQPRVLVVDDSRLMRRAITKILGNEYDIVEATDGEDGWNKLSSDSDVQVVISDLNMPKLDGFGLLEVIRNPDQTDARIREMPVIVVTGAEDDEATREKALSHGATDFITKPFDSVQLHARLKTHVQLTDTSRKLTETTEELEVQSRVDGLTRLANRRSFKERGQKDVAYATRHGRELALLRLDIDAFNAMFIKHGKELSNHILERVGQILAAATRTEDTVARIGVSKFAVILPQADAAGARKLARRISQEIADETFSVDNTTISITASMGLATPELEPELDFDEMVRQAESYLTQAVILGGNQVICDDGPLGEEPAEMAAPAPAPVEAPAQAEAPAAEAGEEPVPLEPGAVVEPTAPELETAEAREAAPVPTPAGAEPAQVLDFETLTLELEPAEQANEPEAGEEALALAPMERERTWDEVQAESMAMAAAREATKASAEVEPVALAPGDTEVPTEAAEEAEAAVSPFGEEPAAAEEAEAAVSLFGEEPAAAEEAEAAVSLFGEEPAAAEEAEAPGLEEAVAMLEQDRIEALTPHLETLLQRVLPLLYLGNDKLSLGIEASLESVKQQLRKPDSQQ